jgi:hypothetical protein
MLRRTIIILIVLLLLLAAAVVTVHIVLRSGLVGDRILARLSEQTGMDVAARSFDVGWRGETTLRGITVKMPLTGEVILSADKMELSHTIVPLLILTRSIHLHSVEVESPKLDLHRDENGRWNAQDVWMHLREGSHAKKPTRGIKLPQIAVRDALIQITEPNGAMQKVGPMQFRGQPQGQSLWVFDLKLPPASTVEGRLAEGRDWAHESRFAIEGIGPLVQQLIHRDLSPIAVAGRWEGSILANGLNGTLQLTQATIGPATLRGSILVEASPAAIALRPRKLVLSEPNVSGAETRLMSGAVRITRQEIVAERLAAQIGAVTGRLDGRWRLGARTGEFSGSWMAVTSGQDSPYYGTYEGAVESPQFGRVQAQVTTTMRAQGADGDWNVAATIQGGGASWQESQWHVQLPQLAWSHGERRIDMADSAAEVYVSWPRIELTSLHLPRAGQVSARAEFQAQTRRWSALLDAENLHVDALQRDSLDLHLNAAGNDQEAVVSELRVALGGRAMRAQGAFSLADRTFRSASLRADWPVGASDSGQPQAVSSGGWWHLEADVTGRLQPLAVEVAGELTGQNIPIGKQMVPRVEIPLNVGVDAERVQMETRPFRLLGGRWQVTGQHEISRRLTELRLLADNLSLASAAGIAGSPLACQGQAKAQIRLSIPNLQIQRAVATGSWSARGVRIAPLEAATASGELHVSGGVARFEDIQLEQGEGRAHASMEFRLDRPQNLSVEIDTQSWPVHPDNSPLSLFADGWTKLQLDVITREIMGEARLTTRILLRDQDLARLRLWTLAQGRVLNVRELYAETLGGSVEGTAQVSLDHWADSAAKLRWSGFRPQLLGQWWPRLERFEGEASGTLVVERTDKQMRPLGPVQFMLDAEMSDGRYGRAVINSCHVGGYLDSDRLIIDDAFLQAMGGYINARGRASTHAGARYASVNTDFDGLDLNQLVHVVGPNARGHTGTIAGNISLLSSLDQASLGGEAEIKLTHSDLANNMVIATLHNALNLQIGKQQPAGTGELELHFEGPAVLISSFEYFNRGIEIRGAGRIKDITAGKESAVDGYAVASSRVLKGIKLPGVRDLDRLMASFQTGVASVKVGGTLDHPQVNSVPLQVISGSFRQLLWAQLRD